MIARQVDPELVRAETIEKMRPHRERLCDYVIQIIRKRGGTPPTRGSMLERIFGTEQGARGCFVHLRDFAARGFA
jgi:hypothetical protein